ncbi:MAG TPA: thioesterase family protein [Acidimicrobiia bacterium]|nr:thioesterase family protein [Acidimicrobiia bacterium]
MADSVTIQRRVQWIDTDAAGIWHHSVVTRWAEEAEAELHRNLGISELTFGATPRVRTQWDFQTPVRFDDLVDVTLTISALGTSSVTYDFDLRTDAAQVATGRIVAVFIDPETGEKRTWPDDVREALAP